MFSERLFCVPCCWKTSAVLFLPILSFSGSDLHRVCAAVFVCFQSLYSFLFHFFRFIAEAKKQQEKIARDVSGQMGKPLKEAKGEVNTMIARTEALISVS